MAVTPDPHRDDLAAAIIRSAVWAEQHMGLDPDAALDAAIDAGADLARATVETMRGGGNHDVLTRALSYLEIPF